MSIIREVGDEFAKIKRLIIWSTLLISYIITLNAMILLVSKLLGILITSFLLVIELLGFGILLDYMQGKEKQRALEEALLTKLHRRK